eukprot:4779940-Amphidinium_carterae.1
MTCVTTSVACSWGVLQNGTDGTDPNRASASALAALGALPCSIAPSSQSHTGRHRPDLTISLVSFKRCRPPNALFPNTPKMIKDRARIGEQM